MKGKLFNQRGVTLVELLASVAIIMVIIGPLLVLTFNLFIYSLEDGERNQTAYIAQTVLEEVKNATYDSTSEDYVGYNIVVTGPTDITETIDSKTINLKEIMVTVKKENSEFKAVTLKTVVRP